MNDREFKMGCMAILFTFVFAMMGITYWWNIEYINERRDCLREVPPHLAGRCP